MGVFSKHRKKVAFVGVVLIFILFIWHFDLLPLQDYHTGIPPWMVNDCETEHYWQDCWEGQGQPGFREMLADTKYVTAYSSGAQDVLSERISFEGHVYEDDWVEPCHPHEGWYEVWVKTGLNDDWEQVISENAIVQPDLVQVNTPSAVGHQTYNYNPLGGAAQVCDLHYCEIQFKGSIVGAVRVDQWTRWESTIPGNFWNKLMSSDYAYLISGQGSVNIVGYDPGEEPTFEIGESIDIHVECDYSGPTVGGSGHWELWAVPFDQGIDTVVIDDNIPDYTRTNIAWTIPTSFWYRGIPDSRFQIILKNTLFDVSTAAACTNDCNALAPPTPTVYLDNDDPFLGDTVTISGQAYTNEETHEELDVMHIKMIWLDTGQEIGYWNNVPVAGEDPYSYNFESTPLNRAADFKVFVWAHDVIGRKSETPGTAIGEVHIAAYRWTIRVKDQDTSQPLQGATVSILQTSQEKTTDSDGEVWFELDNGYYTASIYKQGYRQETVGETIDDDLTSTVFLQQTQILYDLKVWVKDPDDNVIPWALVKVGAVTEAYTNTEGWHQFTDLPEGDYVIEASKGEWSGIKQITLNGNKEITVVVEKGGPGPDMDFVKILFSIIIIAIFAVIGFFFKLPLPFKGNNNFIMIAIGVVIAVIYYFMF